jgi:hypothetical protein
MELIEISQMNYKMMKEGNRLKTLNDRPETFIEKNVMAATCF